MKNLPEFEGRFFVKIHTDGVLEQNITAFAPTVEYITTTAAQIGYKSNTKDDGGYWQDANFSKKMYVSEEWPESSEHHSKQYGLHSSNTVIDFGTTSGASGVNPWDYGVSRHNNNLDAKANIRDCFVKLTTPGTLFRWKNDTTVYKVTFGEEWAMNYIENILFCKPKPMLTL